MTSDLLTFWFMAIEDMQEELYGSAAADVHAEEVEEEAGRWRRVPLHKIPNALAIPRAVQVPSGSI